MSNLKNLSNYKYYNSNSSDHGNFLAPLGFSETKIIEQADIVIFGGGADITPERYGEQPGKRTYCSPAKEKQEVEDFKIAQSLGKKCLGICRGLQLLCTLAGGKLIQHISNHGGCEHTIDTFDGNRVKVNSLHHQMVNPYSM